MPCEDDRPLTQTERAAGFRQQRTGVPRAVRPYMGPIPPGMQALIDYLNREVIPAVRQTREAVNEIYLPSVDNAPSANPLGYYFSTETAAADPTPGRLRLDQATQNTATTLLVSEENGRLQDVGVFLDIMAGSATVPLGVVTLVDSINPGRYVRFDLNAITDQGAYWELDVVPTESSHDNPFVDGEAVILAFMPGVGSTPATVPISVIAPALAGAAGDGLVWDTPNLQFDVQGSTSITVTSDEVRRAALTGAIAAAANANTTVFSGIRENGSAENDRTNLNFVDQTSIIATITDDAGNDELEIGYQRAALTGAIAAATNSNATVFAGIRDNGSAENDRTNLNFVSGTNATVSVTDDAGNDELEVSVSVTSFPLTGLANQAAETFNGNFTAGSAPPTARAGTSVAGAGLTYTAGGTLAVGAGTHITVNADDVTLNLTTLNAAIDSTSIIANTTTLERAALTGAIAATQNSNATLFAGIRDNGSAETDRTNLNFLSSTSCTAVVTDDAANDELEVTFQRAALTGEVTASANANATTIDRATNFVWTGTHEFDNDVAFDDQVDVGHLLGLTGFVNVSTTGTINNLAVGNVSVVRFTGTSGQTVTGIVPTFDGQVLLLINANTGESQQVRLTHEGATSTAANRAIIAQDEATSPGYHRVNRGCLIWYDGTADRWQLVDSLEPYDWLLTHLALQADQEAGSMATGFGLVRSSVQHFHQSAVKAWCFSSGTTREAFYNVSSVTNPSTGLYTQSFSTSFSSTNYVGLATVNGSSNTSNYVALKRTNATGSSNWAVTIANLATLDNPSGLMTMYAGDL